jgi:hypothetical protein
MKQGQFRNNLALYNGIMPSRRLIWYELLRYMQNDQFLK